MTVYDYSPDAIDRHLAKQAQIADWVDDTLQHEPSNPFMPIPGEHAPSEAYYHPPPHPNQLYPQQQQQQQQQPQQYQYQYQYQQPYPAYYATPQGVISPTYSGASKRHHHHHSKHHHHSSGSKSLRPSPHTSYAALPSMPMGLTYAPTPQRSVSTPPSMVMMNAGNVYATANPQQAYLGVGVGYQAMQPAYAPGPMPQGYTLQQAQPPAGYAPAPAYSHSMSQTHSSRHSSSRKHRSRSHSRSTSYSHPPSQPMYPMQSSSSSPYSSGQIVQSPPNQSACVAINGGYVIIPPGQKAVIAPTATYPYASSDYYPRGYDSDSGSERGGSFFGHLNLKNWLGGGGGHKKSKRRGRRDSF